MNKPPVITAPTGSTLTAKSWLTEAPLRMLMNNLDPAVAERPEDLVVYGGIGKAARNWQAFDAIVAALRELGDDETLLILSSSRKCSQVAHAGTRFELAISTRGASSCVRNTPTGLPD